MLERLQKIIAAAGVASRREAELLIQDGRVQVNGTIAVIGDRADPESCSITIDGKPIPGRTERVYIMLNKPAGFACTRRDRFLPDTVYDLLPDELSPLFSVGRLDVDTEGLLLMTNDGDWSNGISHPTKHVSKTYVAEVGGTVSRELLDDMRRGIPLDDGITQPANVRETWSRPAELRSRLSITITEGRKRQVRRMLDYVGLTVLHLKRVEVGGIELGNLPLGRYRYLTEAEVKSLRVDA